MYIFASQDDMLGQTLNSIAGATFYFKLLSIYPNSECRKGFKPVKRSISKTFYLE